MVIMNWQLSFSAIYDYDTRLDGIEIPITLQSGAIKRRLDAKIDTGASHCIFERQHGERLSFDIESGILERFDTAMTKTSNVTCLAAMVGWIVCGSGWLITTADFI